MMTSSEETAQQQATLNGGVHLPPIGQGQTPRSSANIYKRDYGYKAPEGDQQFMTNYRREYAQKSVTPVKQIRNDRVREEPARFEGEPTYSHDYRMWTNNLSTRREKIVRPGAYAPPTGRFQGASNYSSDYTPHVVQPFRRGQKPGDTSRITGDDPFDGTTAYRQSYVRYSLQNGDNDVTYGKKSMQNGGTSGQRMGVQPAPLDEISNYTRDFTRKEIIMQGSSKPKPTPVTSDVPFDSSTTHKTSFTRWSVERPYQHQPAPYVRPDGRMETTTTTRLHYDQKPVEKFVARRPPNSNELAAQGSFDGTSSYSEQFRGRQQQVEDRARPLKRLGAGIGLTGGGDETACFAGQPTYRDDYRGHVASPRQVPPRVEESGKELWETKDGGGASGAGFDGRTNYRDQFVRYPSPERYHREPVTYQPNTTAFDATTNYSVDYTSRDATGARQERYRPTAAGVMPQLNGAGGCEDDAAAGKFDGTTTHRVDFQQYNYTRPELVRGPADHPWVTDVKPRDECPCVVETETRQPQQQPPSSCTNGQSGSADLPPEAMLPLMAPPFKGHTNYGFEYEKWAQRDEVKDVSAAAL